MSKTKDLDPDRAKRMDALLKNSGDLVIEFMNELDAAYRSDEPEVDDRAALGAALLVHRVVQGLVTLRSGVHYEFRSDFGEVPLESMPDINLVTTDVPDN